MNHNNLLWEIIALFYLLFTFSCSESEDKTEEIIQSYNMSVSPSSFNCSDEGGEKRIQISSNDDWSFDGTSIPQWIKVSPIAGSRNGETVISVNTNTTFEKRSAALKLQAKHGPICTINVAQTGKTPITEEYETSIDPLSYTAASADSCNKVFHILSNEEWKIKIYNSWFSIDKTTGSGNADIIVRFDQNTSADSRDGYFYLNGTKSETELRVDLRQPGRIQKLDVNPRSYTAPDSESASVRFDVMSSHEWEAQTTEDWITITTNFDFFIAELKENTDIKDREGNIIVREKVTGSEIKISISQPRKNYTISVDHDQTQFNLNSDDTSEHEIIVHSNDSWTITVISGDNNSINLNTTDSSIKFNIKEPNTTIFDQEWKIKATCDHDRNQAVEITVSQRSANPFTEWNDYSNGETKTISHEKQTINISVHSNENWTVSENVSWISLSRTSGSKDGSFSANIEENTGTQSRSEKVTLKGTNSNISTTLTISQKGKDYKLDVSNDNISTDCKKKDVTIQVYSNDSWTVSKYEPWISLPKTSGSNDGSFTITVSANSSTSSRSGSVTVKGDNSGIIRTISISQDENYTLTVSPESISSDYKGKKATIYVESNDDWTVSTSHGWFSVNKQNGSRNDSFTVTITERTSTTNHEGTITVTGVNSGITRAIKVTQTGAYSLSVDRESITAKSDYTQETINVESNDSWTVTTSDYWISVSQTNGSNNGSFAAYIYENSSVSSRSGNIKVKGTNSGKIITINVSQDGKSSLSIEDFGNDNELKANIRKK